MISDEMIISGLLANPTIAKAAETLDISEETIYSRLRDSDFCKRYNDCKLQMLNDSVDALRNKLALAINTLAEIASDDTARESARVSAATQIISNFIRLDEHTNIVLMIKELAEEMEGLKNE